MNWRLRRLASSLSGLVALTLAIQAQNAPPAGFERIELTVDGVARTALVYAPASAKTNRALRQAPVRHIGTPAAGRRQRACVVSTHAQLG